MTTLFRNVAEKPDESDLPLLDHYAFDEVRSLMSEKFTHVLKIYLEDTAHRLATLEALIAAHEAASGIVHQAHAIRSSSYCFGAMRLAGLAETLELVAGDEKNECGPDGKIDVMRLFWDVKQAFEATRPLLQEYLEKSAA